MSRLLCLAALVACTPPAPPPAAPTAAPARALVAVRVESTEFPKSAELATNLLGRARVRGLPEPTLSKVSLEMIQLSIECVDPTLDCYVAVGKAVSANVLLFGVIEPGAQPGELRFTVSLLDVDAKTFVRRATKLFATEDDAAYDMRLVVTEATKP